MNGASNRPFYDVEVFVQAGAMLESLAVGAGPSSIVLDWQMPVLGGIDACKLVRAVREPSALPILMLTGRPDRSSLVEAIAAGANDYLTKPYNRAELMARVGAMVRTKELHDRRLEAEAQETAARQELHAANQAKHEFFALASHELRTPLNVILGWVQLLQSRHLDADTQVRAIETIERNAKSQARLIEDILSHARGSATQRR